MKANLPLLLNTGDNQNDPAIIIQESMNESGNYSKNHFIQRLRQMTAEEFETFCNDIRRLRYYRDETVGLWATDTTTLLPDNRKGFWQLEY
jgi:hypothetical protein